MNDDLSYDATFVRNRSECARACVLNPTFTCNSYDYCPLDPLNVCKLSKAHIGDNGVSLINSTCDHFSRKYITSMFIFMYSYIMFFCREQEQNKHVTA